MKKLTAEEGKTSRLKNKTILIKYGGNAMVDDNSKQNVIRDIVRLIEEGLHVVIVHGGGPYIGALLERVNLKSEFIGGHRKTDKDAMAFVEMALSGQVNNAIVKALNNSGVRAVGLSGKDASMVKASKRLHEVILDGKKSTVDLGHVGDVKEVDTSLITLLLKNGYIPVISPVGVGEDLEDYNINADMFAGHLAGALKAEEYVVLTDVDGLMKDINDPDSLIKEIMDTEAEAQFNKIIRGGMIPKVESCLIALNEGAKNANIINGMKENTLFSQLLTSKGRGTQIKNQ